MFQLYASDDQHVYSPSIAKRPQRAPWQLARDAQGSWFELQYDDQSTLSFRAVFQLNRCHVRVQHPMAQQCLEQLKRATQATTHTFQCVNRLPRCDGVECDGRSPDINQFQADWSAGHRGPCVVSPYLLTDTLPLSLARLSSVLGRDDLKMDSPKGMPEYAVITNGTLKATILEGRVREVFQHPLRRGSNEGLPLLAELEAFYYRMGSLVDQART